MTIYTLSKQLNIASQNEVRESHHPKAKELMAFLKDIDFHDFNDYFCWKTGGDGDNGEVLLKQLDTFFATKDHENALYLNEKGEVGFIYRPSYGMPWDQGGKRPWLRTHRALVEAVLNKEWAAVQALVNDRYPDEYWGTLEELRVEWFSPGAVVEVTEFDGYERLHEKYIEGYVIPLIP